MLKKLRAESRVLCWFALIGTVYGWVVTYIFHVAFMIWDAADYMDVFQILLGCILLSLVGGVPIGFITGILLGAFRRFPVAWPIVGLLCGGCVFLLWFYSFYGMLSDDPSYRDRMMAIWGTVFGVLTMAFIVVVGFDYNSIRPRLPLMGRLRRAEVQATYGGSYYA